jgi:hypothetical protein
MNSAPDIQYFPASGVWHKPARAARADIVLHGAGSGGMTRAVIADRGENIISANGTGSIQVFSFAADELPDEVKVTVGRGGQPDGRDGYALVVTHLAGTDD